MRCVVSRVHIKILNTYETYSHVPTRVWPGKFNIMLGNSIEWIASVPFVGWLKARA